MKKLICALLTIVLMASLSLDASAQVVYFTVSANGGVYYGSQADSPASTANSTLAYQPASGFINIGGGSIDVDCMDAFVIGTDIELTSAITDTIVEHFDLRIRLSLGLNTFQLGVEPAANRGITFAEFSQRGTYTLSNIKAYTGAGVFNACCEIVRGCKER